MLEGEGTLELPLESLLEYPFSQYVNGSANLGQFCCWQRRAS